LVPYSQRFTAGNAVKKPLSCILRGLNPVVTNRIQRRFQRLKISETSEKISETSEIPRSFGACGAGYGPPQAQNDGIAP
jgi:hypothetical protein